MVGEFRPSLGGKDLHDPPVHIHVGVEAMETST